MINIKDGNDDQATDGAEMLIAAGAATGLADTFR